MAAINCINPTCQHPITVEMPTPEMLNTKYVNIVMFPVVRLVCPACFKNYRLKLDNVQCVLSCSLMDDPDAPIIAAPPPGGRIM